MSLPDDIKHCSERQPPQIIGLLPMVIGVYLQFRCQACGQAFTSYQTTLACVAIGRHTCPQCQAVYEVWPEDFAAALDRFLPPLGLEELTRLTAEATRIAETWYRVGPLARLLTYKGVNLGESAERVLVSFIAQGLYASYCRRMNHG